MSLVEHRPIPGDPGADQIRAMFDLNEGEPWLMTAWGDTFVFAAETMTNDGGNYQRVIAVDLPVRRNHEQTVDRLRLMVSPELAVMLVDDLLNALGYVHG